MTRRGAAAALSYMACSGTRYARSAPSLPCGQLGCLRPQRGLLVVRVIGWAVSLVAFRGFGDGRTPASRVSLDACAGRHVFFC